MDWDKLKVFYAVAEAGNFTKASVKLGLSQSAISRQISSLEDSLGSPLFYRHARGLFLTEQGERLFVTAREIFIDLSMTEALLVNQGNKVQGVLKVTSSIGFGTMWLTPRIPGFLKLYPDLKMEFIFSDDVVDLEIHEADVALINFYEPSPGLYGRKLVDKKMKLYASQEYLEAHGVPLTVEDLDHHNLLVFGDAEKIPSSDVNWLLKAGRPDEDLRPPFLTINNLYGLGRAVESGVGIACLPPYVAAQCQGLVEILQDLNAPEFTFMFVCPAPLQGMKKIEAFHDYLVKCVGEESQIASGDDLNTTLH